jgi:LDH2 family malate/lactate/ureidoglycolate dehydrogenase
MKAVNNYCEIESIRARAFCTSLFESYGFSHKESECITDVILNADFSGIESHGMQRIVRYHEEIISGCVDVHAQNTTVFETAISAVRDGCKAMGQLAGIEAMSIACTKAHAQGVGIITVRNSNHIGICSYYAGLAVKEGLAGICMTNTEAIAVPTFGKKAMLGTNAFAFALDADPVPFSFDIATTVVPRGTIEVFAKNGKALPAGWAVDAQGRETTGAAEVIRNIITKSSGGILPLGGSGTVNGGHKGYGLGIIVDIFTGIFSGGLTSNYINRTPGETGICNCFMAFNPELFGSRAAIKKHLSEFLQELRESPRADGCGRIYTPGERKAENTARRRHGTIPVNEPTLEELRSIARQQAVPFTLL